MNIITVTKESWNIHDLKPNIKHTNMRQHMNTAMPVNHFHPPQNILIT